MKTRLNIIVITILVSLFAPSAIAQEKVIIITLDGLRWQELFGGADKLFIENKEFVSNPKELKKRFWAETPTERREKLMPFVWDYIAKNGAILGNRWEGNYVNLTNTMLFSYPGYNEILTGKADDKRINSNNKINNPNKTILELANTSKTYKNKVMAFGSWDVFPFIINETRSGIPVNAGYRSTLSKKPSEKELFLDKIQAETPRRWGGVRFDVFTHNYALEAMRKEQPDVLFIAYGETDDFAHDGRYDHYLKSAYRTDQMIKEVWEEVNKNPHYKGKTTLFLTTDHGRGDNGKDNSWRSHGSKIKGAEQTWIMAFGKQINPVGEEKVQAQYYVPQFAASIAEILNIKLPQAAEKLPILK